MSKEIKYLSDGQEVTLSFDIIKKYLVSDDIKPTDQEVMMFLQLCKFRKLNPFLKEAYLLKIGTFPATIIVAKDVFIKRASKNPDYEGMQAGIIVKTKDGNELNKDGAIVDDNETLIGGWCVVYNKKYKHPISIKVSFKEYAKRKKSGELNRTWAALPATMIRKVAIVQALREAFPDDFSGMYVSEEINNHNHIINADSTKHKQKLKKIIGIAAIEDEGKIIPTPKPASDAIVIEELNNPKEENINSSISVDLENDELEGTPF